MAWLAAGALALRTPEAAAQDAGVAAPAQLPADRDGDAVPDARDACPGVPGRASADPSDDGCPPRVHVVELGGPMYVPSHVRFAPGSAALGRDAWPLLDEVTAVLRGHPEIRRVAVRGHRSGRGPDARARGDLALRRAEAVRAYLVSRGVDPGRLVVESLGAARPLTPERGAASPENRRVEFAILDAR